MNADYQKPETPADTTEGNGADNASVTMMLAEQELMRYAISHDLRAPLRAILGFSQILKEEEGPQMSPMSNGHLDRVIAAADRMNGMIDALLAQAQLTRSAIENQTVDLSALAHSVSDDLNAAAPRLSTLVAEAVVTWTIEPSMRAAGDPEMIRQVLENLMGNAVKYSGKVLAPHVEVGMVQATSPQVFFVRDNGVGFDMQHADKLFGLFQRLHSSRDFPGSGVGLAGVHVMVRRHGGRIWAEAKPGQGACFYFTLTSPNAGQPG